MRRQIVSAVMVVVLLIAVGGCGKKKKNLFDFTPSQKRSLPCLRFSSVHRTRIAMENGTPHLTWEGIKPSAIQQTTTWVHGQEGYESVDVSLVGYNIYRFTPGGFISRNPINRRPIVATTFDISQHARYKKFFVRAVFVVGKEIYEGGASRTVSH